MGFSKEEIAFLSKVYGLIMTLLGAGAGGILIMRYGTMKILFVAQRVFHVWLLYCHLRW
jgi:PAT family beta-lactamase induction signal transducer AmpG